MAVGAAGVLSAVAVAAAPYVVKPSAPSLVQTGQTYRVKAQGTSSGSSRLNVFVASKSCAASATVEKGRALYEVINTVVLHVYAKAKATKTNSAGSYRVCAYLVRGSTTLAHGAASYTVVLGGY